MEIRHLITLNTLELLSFTEHEMDFGELEAQVLSSLEHLPGRCKEIFILSLFENLSNREIAQKLQLSNRTVVFLCLASNIYRHKSQRG